MNLARVLEIDDHPTLVIYAKQHGSHQHTDIKGFTELETGKCTSVRFDKESMPAKGEDTTVWLINKTQKVLGTHISSRSWDGDAIDIMRVHKPTSEQSVTEAA
jgi:hypothetical protein